MYRPLWNLATLGFVICLSAGVARAQDPGGNAPEIISEYGSSISVGGGAFTMADGTARDYTDPGGLWEARVALGTREYIAVEAAYTGTAQNIEALGLDDDASLISTGFEAMARGNLLQGDWQPYVGGGVGWRRYDLINADVNTSSVTEDDNVLEIPIAAGLAYRYRGLVVDLRSTLRFALAEDLIAAEPGSGGDKPDLHTWGGQITAGWEF